MPDDEVGPETLTKVSALELCFYFIELSMFCIAQDWVFEKWIQRDKEQTEPIGM